MRCTPLPTPLPLSAAGLTSLPRSQLSFPSYLKCSPLSHAGVMREQRLARAALVPRGPRRLAVFGLGLEHAASNLVDNLLWAPQSPFRVTGMSPGMTGEWPGGDTARWTPCTMMCTMMHTQACLQALYALSILQALAGA